MKTILELGIGDKIYVYDFAIKELVIGQIICLVKGDFGGIILEFQTIIGPEWYPLMDVITFTEDNVKGVTLTIINSIYRRILISSSLDLILGSILNENIQ